jgi:hypothetical protein
VRFPRGGPRPSDAQWRDEAENTQRSTRKSSEASVVTWLEVASPRDEDDGDGGSAA